MSQFLRHVIIRNHESARISIAESIDEMEWEATPQEDPPPGPASLQQLAPQADHQQHQPGISQATAPINHLAKQVNPQSLHTSRPYPVPQRPQSNFQPNSTMAPNLVPQPIQNGPKFYPQHRPLIHPRPQPVPRKTLAEELISRHHSTRPVTGVPFTNGQAYKRNAVALSETWHHLKQAEDLAIQRKMDQLRNQSSAQGSNKSYTPSRSILQSGSPNSRKRLIEAVDGYSQDECRTSRDVIEGPQYSQQQAACVNAMPESPIDTSMVDAPLYESSLLTVPSVNGDAEEDVFSSPQLPRTPRHMPGAFPMTPASGRQISIPPTEIFHLTEVDIGIIRDQVALMSGALTGDPRTSSRGIVVPLSDGTAIPPTSPEHAYELQQKLTYLQQLLQIIRDVYYPSLKAMRFAIDTVGNMTKRTYREFVQVAVEVAGSAKRRAVAIYDNITPGFVRRKINRQQDTKNLRRPSSNERHHLKARQLGMGKRKQDSSSPQVTLDEYEDVTPPRPPPDMPPSQIIRSFRPLKETSQVLRTTKKDGVMKGAKVQKKKLSNKAKLKTKAPSRTFLAQLTKEDVNKLPLSRAPRRGELIKGAWPNAIPRSEAALRAFHESFRELRNTKPIVGVSETAKPPAPLRVDHGVYFPGPENQPPLPPLPATTIAPSTSSPTELPPLEESITQPDEPVESEEPEPSKEGPPPLSPEYEGFLTSPPRSRREVKEVNWFKSDSPMGRPISSVRAYDPLSRVASFQPHELAKADASIHSTPESMDKETPADQSVQRPQPLLRSPEAPYVKHLTAFWEAKVDRAMALPDKNVVGTTPRGDSLTRRDLNTCYTKLEWLNDEVINAYLGLIVDYAREAAGNSGRHDKPKYHAFSSFFFSSLREKGYGGVQRWAIRAKIAGEGLLRVETLFIPIHDRVHWTLMVIKPAARTIEHFDSLGSLSMAYVAKAKEWLRGELGDLFVEEEWRVLPSISPQQNNGSDCGVFLLTTAKLVSLGQPLKYGARDIPEIRKRIVAELINGGFSGDFDPKNEMVPARSLL
ncbi:hypothetical protein GX50_02945 [[Emmonsia] crescens]|uniref:Ubiquitin-like protease family profile domain-containing protein n=1 Tax=[Emmonsia] crescens TaxID=73230 RepID=A0A2B7ZM64_9EURO|nr:hypothetical protein GX50_02945 [Emmonsia crescens]